MKDFNIQFFKNLASPSLHLSSLDTNHNRINLPPSRTLNMAENVTESENQERVIWSTSRLYLSLLEAFPKYVQDFQAKWKEWQQVISAEEFVPLNP